MKCNVHRYRKWSLHHSIWLLVYKQLNFYPRNTMIIFLTFIQKAFGKWHYYFTDIQTLYNILWSQAWINHIIKTESLNTVTASTATAVLHVVSFITISSLVDIGPSLPPMLTFGRVSAGANGAVVISDICNHHQQRWILRLWLSPLQCVCWEKEMAVMNRETR